MLRVRAVARTNSRARGLGVRADARSACSRRGEENLSRAPSARSLSARHAPCFASAAASAVLVPACPRSCRGHGPCRAGDSVSVRAFGARPEAARGGSSCPARSPGLARACPCAWVEDRSPAEDRRRTRAGESTRNDRPSGSSRYSRAPQCPRRVYIAPRYVNGRAKREPGGERGAPAKRSEAGHGKRRGR